MSAFKRTKAYRLGTTSLILGFAVTACLSGCVAHRHGPEEQEPEHQEMEGTSYLPNADASKVVSVTTNGQAYADIVVQTQAVAVKEGGPKETVARFGEVYAFSPAFIAVHRDEPTRIRFWNLQADDEHDVMLIDPPRNVLMKVMLPPLQETSFVFTFHEEGLFDFVCAMHRPAMNGQILVLPPRPSETP
jgi:plastocyanin